MRYSHLLITAIVATVISIAACESREDIPKSLEGIKGTVAQLDADVTAYGRARDDSTYNHALDTLVADLMAKYDPQLEEKSQGDRYALRQQAHADARATWTKFKRLIDNDKYADALDLYLKEDKGGAKSNAGDIIVFLRHSSQRYVFYTKVLLPLLSEYKDRDFALNEFIDVLQFEKVMMECAMAEYIEKNVYVPEHYPNLVLDLGFSLNAADRMEEALDLFNDLIAGIFALSGDALGSNFSGTAYIARIYLNNGMNEWAVAAWDNFKEYLQKYKDDYDPDELAHYLSRIEEERSSCQQIEH